MRDNSFKTVAAMLGAILFFGFCSLALARDEGDLPARVDGFFIDRSIREEVNKLPTADLRIARLSAIIEANNKATNEAQNLKASSAIRLLGAVKSTNCISELVSNLNFTEIKTKQRPVVQALAAIGEPAIPALLRVLEDSSASEEKCLWAVEAMKWIKQAGTTIEHTKEWDRFMLEQKNKMSKKGWERLWRSGSMDD
jgi:HEAT repeat protein